MPFIKYEFNQCTKCDPVRWYPKEGLLDCLMQNTKVVHLQKPPKAQSSLHRQRRNMAIIVAIEAIWQMWLGRHPEQFKGKTDSRESLWYWRWNPEAGTIWSQVPSTPLHPYPEPWIVSRWNSISEKSADLPTGSQFVSFVQQFMWLTSDSNLKQDSTDHIVTG